MQVVYIKGHGYLVSVNPKARSIAAGIKFSKLKAKAHKVEPHKVSELTWALGIHFGNANIQFENA